MGPRLCVHICTSKRSKKRVKIRCIRKIEAMLPLWLASVLLTLRLELVTQERQTATLYLSGAIALRIGRVCWIGRVRNCKAHQGAATDKLASKKRNRRVSCPEEAVSRDETSD